MNGAAKALSEGDIEGLLSYYEPGAVLAPAVPPGAPLVRGRGAIRDVFDMCIAMDMVLRPMVTDVVEAADVALVSGSRTATLRTADGSADLAGTFSDVLRRQPDGSWLYVIDNPVLSG